MPTSHQQGKLAEDRALSYLKKKGLKLLQRNFRSKQGEIDLIMRDHGVTVFIEIRARSNNSIIDALETIDQRKCARIIKTSEYYLLRHRPTSKDSYRFDIVIISGPLESAKIEWIKNAFEA